MCAQLALIAYQPRHTVCEMTITMSYCIVRCWGKRQFSLPPPKPMMGFCSRPVSGHRDSSPPRHSYFCRLAPRQPLCVHVVRTLWPGTVWGCRPQSASLSVPVISWFTLHVHMRGGLIYFRLTQFSTYLCIINHVCRAKGGGAVASNPH